MAEQEGNQEESDLIDLTDEAFEDADVPRHYISWLTDLIKNATIKPTTMDQRLEGAAVSSDVIVIDEEESSETNKKSTNESRVTKASHQINSFKFLQHILTGYHQNLKLAFHNVIYSKFKIFEAFRQSGFMFSKIENMWF